MTNFACDFCGDSFSKLDHLETHITESHENRNKTLNIEDINPENYDENLMPIIESTMKVLNDSQALANMDEAALEAWRLQAQNQLQEIELTFKESGAKGLPLSETFSNENREIENQTQLSPKQNVDVNKQLTFSVNKNINKQQQTDGLTDGNLDFHQKCEKTDKMFQKKLEENLKGAKLNSDFFLDGATYKFICKIPKNNLVSHSDYQTLSCRFGFKDERFKFYVQSNKFSKVIELVLKTFFGDNLSHILIDDENFDSSHHRNPIAPNTVFVPNALISQLAEFSKLILPEECLKGVSFQDLINWTVSKIRNHHLQKQSARKKGENVAGIETDKNTATSAQPSSKIVLINAITEEGVKDHLKPADAEHEKSEMIREDDEVKQSSSNNNEDFSSNQNENETRLNRNDEKLKTSQSTLRSFDRKKYKGMYTEPKYNCNFCQYSTNGKDNYNLHCLTAYHKKNLDKSKEKSKNWKPDNDEVKKYKCDLCNYATNSRGNLNLHFDADYHLDKVRSLQNSVTITKVSEWLQSSPMVQELPKETVTITKIEKSLTNSMVRF